MIVHVTPSIDRPWSDGGGFYSCPPFPPTVFTELSPSVEVKQVRDALGRWRSVRGVDESMQRAVLAPARAVRCREPHGGEGVLILGGELGVLMLGVGTPGHGSPILWVADLRDLPATAVRVLRSDLPSTERADAGPPP